MRSSTRSHVGVVVGLALFVGVPAARAENELSMPAANSGPAKSLARDLNGYASSLKSECLRDKPKQWEDSLASYEQRAANLADAADKAAWSKYVASLRALFKERHDGTPTLGTFADMQAKHKTFSAELDALKPTETKLPDSVADAKKLSEKITTYLAKTDEILAFAEKVRRGTRCETQHTGDWYGLGKRAEAEKRAVSNQASELVYNDARAINAWQSNLPQNYQQPGKDWWEHVQYAGNVLEQLGKAQQFYSKLDVLVALAPLSSSYEAKSLPERATFLKEYFAKNMPIAKQLIGEIMVPKAPGGAKELAELKKLLLTYPGKQIGTSSARKPGTETFEEWDGGKKYKVVKKKYSGYYVWKPDKPSVNTPVIEGINPEDICELWATNLVLYEKGGPSHAPLKKWRGDQSVFMGFMLCSNKDKKSPRPYK